MSETLKATIVGTIIIGIFMLVSVKMVTGTVWDLARSAKSYMNSQKVEMVRFVKDEKHKAKDVAIEVAEKIAEKQ